jgi:hypothetical protein
LEVHSSHAITRGLGLFRWLFFFTGPILTNQAMYPDCIQALNETAKRLGYVKVVYRSWDFPCSNPVNPYPVPGFLRTEYIIDLTPPICDIEKNVKPAQRRNIRHAVQSGLELVEETSREKCIQLHEFIEVTKHRRQQRGYSQYEKYYIPYLCDRVMNTLVDNHYVRLFHVERGGTPLHATAIITQGKRAYALLAGTTEQGYRMKASPFGFYQICLQLKQEGTAYLNLGGVPEDDGTSHLRRFKRTLGAQEYACPTGSTGFLQNGVYKVGLDLYKRCVNELIH